MSAMISAYSGSAWPNSLSRSLSRSFMSPLFGDVLRFLRRGRPQLQWGGLIRRCPAWFALLQLVADEREDRDDLVLEERQRRDHKDRNERQDQRVLHERLPLLALQARDGDSRKHEREAQADRVMQLLHFTLLGSPPVRLAADPVKTPGPFRFSKTPRARKGTGRRASRRYPRGWSGRQKRTASLSAR